MSEPQQPQDPLNAQIAPLLDFAEGLRKLTLAFDDMRDATASLLRQKRAAAITTTPSERGQGEPTIIVNGTTLSEGQAMTVRVALESFMLDLQSNGLGDDTTGKKIANGYLARGVEVRNLMVLP
jgi:hypothetical protein